MPLPITHDLALNLHRVSPRYAPPHRPWLGPLIWLSAVVLFIALFGQGFVRMGVAAWAVGLVYICYDTALLMFVARQTVQLNYSDEEPTQTVGGTESQAPALTGKAQKLGVIIAAYNEAAVLEVTINALSEQQSPPDLIIIADDGSDDDSAAVLAGTYQLQPPPIGSLGPSSPVAPTLRWLRLPRGGKARALNVAIGLVDTDLLLTVDADTLLDPGALVAMRRAFASDPSLVAATGVLRPVCDESLTGRVFQWFQSYEYVRNFLSRYAWMGSNSLLLISGAFAGFRRDALIAVGGFDPDCLVEDYEVMHRIHRISRDDGLGWHVGVIGGARARTDSPGRLLPFLRQRRRWFAGFLQTQYWNRDMIGNRRYGALGTAMLPVKALDTVQPLYGLSAFALLIWFVSTGTFRIVWPVLIAMGVKILIDLAYLLWSLRLYRLWTGQRLSASGALFAAVVEPVTFQLLRHAGAAWGWWVFLTGQQVWGQSERGGIAAWTSSQHDRSTEDAAG